MICTILQNLMRALCYEHNLRTEAGVGKNIIIMS